MESVSCRRCGQALEFSGQRPSFCAYCGQPLDDSGLNATVDYSPAPGAERPAAPAPPDAFPERLAGYRLIRRIGDGGMGTVFEAEDEAHGRRVALKILSDRLGAGPEAIERFRLEGRLAATISHPRCVFVLAADEVDGRPYIVMELMTGQTLQGVVDQGGPMPAEAAVARVLDVIDGLTEAHRLGVIHRDVKPSNCFLESGGRVKIGDFGLSKSLAADSRLTRTGSFIGTPLYASAEQIKGDPVDVRTDVYSVCATLYFLLTGRPPFEAVDAAAVLARIVSEPPRPLRELQPDVPIGLESAVMRGLDRDRERRWRSLAELREALIPFAPHPIPDAPPMVRLAAFAVDLGAIGAVLLVLHLLAFRTILGEVRGLILADVVSWLAYFAPLEGWLGGGLGKRLFRLRVFRDDRRAEPGPLRAAARAAVLYAAVVLPMMLATGVMERAWGARIHAIGPEFWAYLMALVLLPALGMAAIVAPMRRRNGYRGLHELLSGTRTVRLPRVPRRREQAARRRSARDSSVIRRPMGVLDRVGSYRVRGAVRWDAGRRVLAAEDSGLGREVWIVLGPPGGEPPDPSRRELNRSTRSRWLSGGDLPEGRWDAFTAPSGAPLADVAGPDGLPWAEARPILTELAEELVAATADGTLPESLSLDQVWVEPDGRVQLVDPLGGPPPARGAAAPPRGPERDEPRAVDLLRRVAALALEGGRRRSDDATSPIRAPVPQHARDWLDRLAGPGAPRLAELRDGLRAIAGEADELGFVPRANRAGTYLASIPLRLGATALVLGLLEMSGLASLLPRVPGLGPLASEGVDFAAVFLLLGAGLAAATRCRLLSGVVGAVLVRNDGMRPTRLHCALREALIWAPPLALALLALAVRDGAAWTAPAWLLPSLWGLPAAWILLELAHELAFPGRMLHDRIAGTRLVPL